MGECHPIHDWAIQDTDETSVVVEQCRNCRTTRKYPARLDPYVVRLIEYYRDPLTDKIRIPQHPTVNDPELAEKLISEVLFLLTDGQLGECFGLEQRMINQMSNSRYYAEKRRARDAYTGD